MSPIAVQGGALLAVTAMGGYMAGPIHANGAMGPPVPVSWRSWALFAATPGHDPVIVVEDHVQNGRDLEWSFETLADGSVEIHSAVPGP